MNSTIKIQDAKLEDCLFVYKIRTDKRDEKNYFTQVSSFEEHKKFWEKHHGSYKIVSLDNKQIAYYGIVRGDFRIAITNEMRGKGIGKMIVQKAIKMIGDNEIKIAKTNERSIKMFKSCGFRILKEIDNQVFMVKQNQV